MKTKVKRLSKRTLALVLGMMILVSCIVVGSFTTNAYTSLTIYYTKSSSGQWSSATSRSMTLSNSSASVSLELSASSTYRFVIVGENNDWWGNNSFDLSSQISKTNTLRNYYSFSTSKAVTENPNTLKTSSAASYTITFNTNTKSCTVSGGNGGAAVVCSTDQTYRVVGTANLCGSAWANTATANNLTYSSTYACYTKTYSNVDAATMDFRIIEDSTWSNDRGFTYANAVVDASTIVSSFIVKPGDDSDNNIRMTTTQKANIEIRYDDSKNGSTTPKAITVIVTPAVSTVTAGSPTGGSVSVNGGASASNIAYGDKVDLVATPSANYHFVSWDSNASLAYDNENDASTKAAVTGSTTVTATFAGDDFSVTKASEEGYTITAPTAGTAAYNSTVSVSATAASGYYIDGLYYKEQGSDTEHAIGGTSSDHTTNTSLTNKTFTMPAANVTIYAWVHEKASNTVTYGVCTGQSGWGYVSVGYYHDSASTIKYTLDSDKKVLEGDKVNFCARPAAGYKFVGWYDTSANTGGNLISSDADNTVTSPNGNYFARFESLTATSGIRVYIPDSLKDYKVWYWGAGLDASSDGISTEYNTKIVTDYGTAVELNGSKFYYIDFAPTQTVSSSNKFNFRLTTGSTENNNEFTSTGTYTFSNATTNSAAAPTFDIYYPVNYYVTNPDKGDMDDTYTNAFAKKSNSATFYVKAADADNWKYSRTTSGFTDDLNDTSTETSFTRTMPSGYSSTPTTTIKFVEKEYYKITFSAGKGGSVRANISTASGTVVKNKTTVQEGKKVVFTATPDSGYEVAGWECSGDLSNALTSSDTSKTVNSLTQDTTVRVYFKKSKGTESTATYLGYRDNYNDPTGWNNFVETYVWSGRVYGYIDDVSNDTYYHFQAYEKNPTTTAERATKQYYRNNAKTWANTQFSDYIKEISRKEYYKENGTCYYISFKVASAAVKAVMIDLGPEDSTTAGKARPELEKNTYHIIPIINKDAGKVTVYAKDASYRGNDDYDYLTKIADTKIDDSATYSAYVTNIGSHTEFETAVATKGQKIKVTTTIDSDHRDTFFVLGYSVNGVTPELYEKNDDGVYSMEYTIPADFEYDYLEITPIYSGRATGTNLVRFYIENYDEAFQNTGWGNTLAVYPYYQDSNGDYAEKKNNAFGGYPGQPVINYGGRRYIEIPTTYNTLTVDTTTAQACTIKGVTLSNDYFDIVHHDYCREVKEHLQTYDYDDFYKIYVETTAGQEVNHSGEDGRGSTADQISFAFKYRTATNNFSDSGETITDYAKVTSTYAGKTVKAPYADFTAEEKTSKFGNGWEDLLDYHDRPVDLFGKQLTTAQQTQDPILVVSDDYAISYVGRYATSWTVYAWNSTTSKYEKVEEIPPSALIVTSKSRVEDTTIYPNATNQAGYPDQVNLSSLGTKYETLKAYAGRPVQITYESEIKNDSSYGKYWNTGSQTSDVAKRSDGRWFYSYMNEKIRANLRIDYAPEDLGELTVWTSDTFKSGTNKGSVTGATVQFTNTADDTEGGNYALAGLHDTADFDGDVVSNFNHYFKFAATSGSGYIFKGWYMERDGISTAVTPDNVASLTGKSQMTSNATFVARYIKNPAGHLTINHTLAEGSVGSATTYIGVQAIKGETSTWLTGEGGAEGYVENDFTIDDATYTSYNSGYTFRVYLKTVPQTFTDFDRFSSASDTNSSKYFSVANQSTSAGATITYFDIPANDLFALDANSFPVQQFDEVTYYSRVKSSTYKYNFNFKYPAYLAKYGTQGYRVTGTFTYKELNDYMMMSGDNLVFKDATVKEGYLNKIAPYEDNFMQTISWNVAAVTTSFNTGTDTISATINANEDSTKKITLSFDTNFEMDQNTYQPIENPTYLADDARASTVVKNADLPSYLNLFEPSGNYVTAPRELMNGETKMIFRYWSVTNVPDSKHSAEEYTRCYDDQFNFVLYQNSIVTSVYTAKTSDKDGYDPYGAERADASNGIKISFIENSRNQYNDGQSSEGGTESMTSSRSTQGDRMYTEFLMNYNNIAGNTIFKDLGAGVKKAGLLIELVGNIDYEDGVYTTKTEAEYRDEYGATISEIGAKLSGKDNIVDQLLRLTNRINNEASGDKATAIISQFDASELNNKNRRQYAYSIANRSHSDFSILDNRYKIFRAYAYIGDVQEGTTKLANIQISDKPTYFTIYDMASIQN